VHLHISRARLLHVDCFHLVSGLYYQQFRYTYSHRSSLTFIVFVYHSRPPWDKNRSGWVNHIWGDIANSPIVQLCAEFFFSFPLVLDNQWLIECSLEQRKWQGVVSLSPPIKRWRCCCAVVFSCNYGLVCLTRSVFGELWTLVVLWCVFLFTLVYHCDSCHAGQFTYQDFTDHLLFTELPTNVFQLNSSCCNGLSTLSWWSVVSFVSYAVLVSV
jgi:hypothetical protein